VTFASGTSATERAAILGVVGAIETDAIPALRMYAVELPEATVADDVAALSAFAQVVRVDADRTRAAEAVPSDPRYDDQWSLPIIGWDQAFGTVSPSGSAKVAVLDTGVDASHPDLDSNIATGASFVAGSPWDADPNGHGTAMAGMSLLRRMGRHRFAEAGVKACDVPVPTAPTATSSGRRLGGHHATSSF
jgi:thermitase